MRTELEKEEPNARHAFEMLSQDLKAQFDQATQARTKKAEAKAKALQAAADAKGDLQDTTTTRVDNSRIFLTLLRLASRSPLRSLRGSSSAPMRLQQRRRPSCSGRAEQYLMRLKAR